MTTFWALYLYYFVHQLPLNVVLGLAIAGLWHLIFVANEEMKFRYKLLDFACFILSFTAFAVFDSFYALIPFYVPMFAVRVLWADDMFEDSEQGAPERTPPDTPPAHGREAEAKEGAL